VEGNDNCKVDPRWFFKDRDGYRAKNCELVESGALGLNEPALSKVYGQICVLWHLVTLIGPSSNWISMVADIVDSKPSLPNCGFTAMGFPGDTGFPRHLF
jgi:hypothetical protein